MANPTCTSAELVENASAFTQATLTPAQQRALKIHANVLELAAMGGTDYSAVLETTLVEDAETLARAMNPDQIRAARVHIARNNATAAGATVPTVDTSVAAVARLALADPKTLDDIELLLECNLGVHKAYPQ